MFYLFIDGIDIKKRLVVQKEMVKPFLTNSFNIFPILVEPSENRVFAQTKIFGPDSEKCLNFKIKSRDQK